MILALDISTTCIGYCVFNNSGKLLKMSCVKFNSKQTKFERLEKFIVEMKQEGIDKMSIETIAIEEPLKKFKGKFSSADTIAILNHFNGMISSWVYTNFNSEPAYYNVLNARATVFPGLKVAKEEGSIKHEVWRKVMEKEPQINWRYSTKTRKLMDENYDMSDAYTAGMCHFIVMQKQLEAK
jgi:Holliday junction resolvasome RuvABC endonuclease subunit